MGVDVSKVGLTRDSEEFRVNTARIAQFAASLDDTSEAHLNGRLAPPVFHHIPVMQSLVEVLKAATDGFVIHGEHDFHFERAIEPGMRLFTLTRLIGIKPSKAGAQLYVRSDLTTHDGKKVSTQYSTCLVTAVKDAKAAGEAAPAKPEAAQEGNPSAFTHKLSADQAFRYADAARDYSPYTLDTQVAASHGFPAPILHGMCTIGIAARAIVDEICKGDVRKLARLGGRFSALVFMVPGQQLTTRVWAGSAKGGKRMVAFETEEKDGKAAIARGFAEVRA